MRGYGAIRSKHAFTSTVVPPRTREVLPPVFSLSAEQLPAPNQGSLNTCVGFMGSRLIWHRRKKLGLSDIGVPSARQLVQDTIANENDLWNTKADIASYAGCGIVDMCYTAQWGICNEQQWPYSADRASLSRFAPQATREIMRHHCLWDWSTFREDGSGQYAIEDMKACLFAGQTFGFGFMVWDGLKLDPFTHVITPAPVDVWPGMVAHAVVACGWDDTRQAFQFLNWYGSGYGIGGNGYYRYSDMRFPFAFDPVRLNRFWDVETIA